MNRDAFHSLLLANEPEECACLTACSEVTPHAPSRPCSPPGMIPAHGTRPIDLRNRRRRILRLADCADSESPRTVGEVDAGRSCRIAGAVRGELRASMLDFIPQEIRRPIASISSAVLHK